MKFLILTDSLGNPRPFPEESKVSVEETFPYLLRDKYKESIFWQLSYGNLTSDDLINQAAGYVSNWNPDYVIIQSGINDCRPEAFTEFQKIILNKTLLFNSLKDRIYDPNLIRRRAIYRVSEKNFKKSALKLRNLFSSSKIFWLEVSANDNYENKRPGVKKRMRNYNKILESIFKEGFLEICNQVKDVDGFNKDGLHLNVFGHKEIFRIITQKL
tara:strand:+ start:3769 stop:4410 length:642 start_codon:yes stop_codon:yes gene_type:complete